jgi:hypothetical protein
MEKVLHFKFGFTLKNFRLTLNNGVLEKALTAVVISPGTRTGHGTGVLKGRLL